MILVLAAEGDEALAASSAIAALNAARLSEEGSAVQLFRADSGLHLHLLTPSDGVAIFCHGSEYSLGYGRPDATPILHHLDVSPLRGRWCYAFACLSGRDLGAYAIEGGCSCYVGYTVRLHADWRLDELDPVSQAHVRRFLTETATLLARGVRSEREIGARLLELQDNIDQTYDALNQTPPDWLVITLLQLARHLRVHIATSAD